MIVCFEEKYGNYYVEGESIEQIMQFVLRHRLCEGWYFGEEVDRAEKALASNNATDFMSWRRDGQYEYWDVISVTEAI